MQELESLLTAQQKSLSKAFKDCAHVQALVNDLGTKAGYKFADFSAGTFTINLTGGKPEVTNLIRVLRNHGYDSSRRPEGKQTYYSEFWKNEKDNITVFVCFSSTYCRSVKVGTKMVEVPIYDVVCGEVNPYGEAGSP